MKLRDFFDRFRRRPEIARRPLHLDGRVYAVGDVHGRHDLLQSALARIAEHRAGYAGASTLVMLGDYIDRGDGSAEVLRTLRALQGRIDSPVVTLMGNHERMMLDFLRDPARRGRAWLSNGGVQTLSSFGVGGVSEMSPPKALTDAAARLTAAMGDDLTGWLAGMSLHWRSGNLLCVHAGLDPGLPPEAQEEETFLWGHPEFRRRPRRDGLWVAHGHTVVEAPSAVQGRIALDTGAWATGRLTIGVIEADAISFLTATNDDQAISD